MKNDNSSVWGGPFLLLKKGLGQDFQGRSKYSVTPEIECFLQVQTNVDTYVM